jgi:hypothetical protein
MIESNTHEAPRMRAFVLGSYGGPEHTVLTELPRPSPGASELLVRVHAAGINPVDFNALFDNWATQKNLARAFLRPIHNSRVHRLPSTRLVALPNTRFCYWKALLPVNSVIIHKKSKL